MKTEQLVDKALSLYEEQDSFAAIAFLLDQPDPKDTVAALVKCMRHKYWQEKDLVGALAFARAGTHFGLQAALAHDGTDAGLAHQLRCDAKGFAYDFASFAWDGWDEPGVEITTADIAAWRDAAKVNLRLAVDLKRGDLPVSRAHWLRGAYHFSDGAYEAAAESFESGIAFACKAGALADELLNRGFVLVARMLAAPDDADCGEKFNALKMEFKSVEHGDGYIQQLDTALEVFRR